MEEKNKDTNAWVIKNNDIMSGNIIYKNESELTTKDVNKTESKLTTKDVNDKTDSKSTKENFEIMSKIENKSENQIERKLTKDNDTESVDNMKTQYDKVSTILTTLLDKERYLSTKDIEAITKLKYLNR